MQIGIYEINPRELNSIGLGFSNLDNVSALLIFTLM